MADEVPTVPPINTFKKEPVFVKGSVSDQAGARKGYRRQWVKFGEDVESRRHPSHVDKYIRGGEIWVGDADIGFCKAEPWTIVERRTAKPGGRKRDDDTAGIDTALTNGDLICIETPEDNARIWDKHKELRADRRASGLRSGERDVTRADNGGAGVVTARLGQGEAGADPRAAIQSLLNQ